MVPSYNNALNNPISKAGETAKTFEIESESKYTIVTCYIYPGIKIILTLIIYCQPLVAYCRRVQAWKQDIKRATCVDQQR